MVDNPAISAVGFDIKRDPTWWIGIIDQSIARVNRLCKSLPKNQVIESETAGIQFSQVLANFNRLNEVYMVNSPFNL